MSDFPGSIWVSGSIFYLGVYLGGVSFLFGCPGSFIWVSDLVLGSRLDPRHDLLEFIGQFGMGSQASVHAAGQVGNAVGTRQAKEGGELVERDFAVAAAEPGSHRTSDVGIYALGQC